MNIKTHSSNPNNTARKYFDNSDLIVAGIFTTTLAATGTLDQISPLIIFIVLTTAFLIIELNIAHIFIDIRDKLKKALMENYTFSY